MKESPQQMISRLLMRERGNSEDNVLRAREQFRRNPDSITAEGVVRQYEETHQNVLAAIEYWRKVRDVPITRIEKFGRDTFSQD
jgi:hypothetical protein